MKKFFLVLSLCLMTAAPVWAHHPMSRPRPPVFHVGGVPHGHRIHHGDSGIYFLSGLAGAAVGSLIVGAQYQNQNRTDNNERCFVVISKSSGNVTKKCVSGSGYDEVVYVD